MHSLQGRRAAALMTIHLCLEGAVAPSGVLEQARALGLDCALEQLEHIIVAEVERRSPPPPTTAGPPRSSLPSASGAAERSLVSSGAGT